VKLQLCAFVYGADGMYRYSVNFQYFSDVFTFYTLHSTVQQ
jgi:hypothetical protein